MASTTTQIQIANRALQILGYQPISSLTENSRGARAVNRCYQPVLLKTLREHYWGFSIKRVQLAASATPPLFGKANYFPLPPDYICLAPPDYYNDSANGYNTASNAGLSNGNQMAGSIDWQIENTGNGLAIATDDNPPIYVRYVSSAVTESQFDVSFAEAFSADLAYEMCEELTQSNTKFANIEKVYDNAIQSAAKRNAFEMRPMNAPVDSWITRRF